MIHALLGESIDIHGGGIDLVFPHHENEIAQGEGCSDQTYCRYWMHNEFINLKDQKMSKSLGNVISGRSFMEKYHPEILKFIMLSSHYRTLININDERISHALSGLARIYKALREASLVTQKGGEISPALTEAFEKHDAAIVDALNDDFHTGEMIAHIYEVVRVFNAQNKTAFATAKAFREWVCRWGRLASLFQENPATFLQKLDDILIEQKGLVREEIEALVTQRKEARQSRNWEKADEIRHRLKDMGVEIHDGAGESSWEMIKY